MPVMNDLVYMKECKILSALVRVGMKVYDAGMKFRNSRHVMTQTFWSSEYINSFQFI